MSPFGSSICSAVKWLMEQRNTCCFSDHWKLCIAYGSYVNNLRKGCPVFQHILFVKSQLLDWATLGKVETSQNMLTLTKVVVGANEIRKNKTNKKQAKNTPQGFCFSILLWYSLLVTIFPSSVLSFFILFLFLNICLAILSNLIICSSPFSTLFFSSVLLHSLFSSLVFFISSCLLLFFPIAFSPFSTPPPPPPHSYMLSFSLLFMV